MKRIAWVVLAWVAVIVPGQAYAGCVSMQSKGGAVGNWEVVNGCPYKVVGKFCYEGDRGILSCQKKGGGFGPISAGGREMVSPPENKGTVRWRVDSCKYDDWVKGSCRM